VYVPILDDADRPCRREYSRVHAPVLFTVLDNWLAAMLERDAAVFLSRVFNRPTMITYGVDNIRDLFGHKVKLSMSKAAPIVRLDKARVK
jgi:hypothetical protein